MIRMYWFIQGVAQWQSAGLACARPLVQSSTLQRAAVVSMDPEKH